MYWGAVSPEVYQLGYEADHFPYLVPRLRMRSKHRTRGGDHSLNVTTGKINKMCLRERDYCNGMWRCNIKIISSGAFLY